MINKSKINSNLILIILFLAFVLRFWRLGDYPALNADEAAIGYNAYSLIETGKDEHGNSWPIHFQSFNDYKPGLYFYIVLPLVKIIGLSVWAVRIPGAFLGVATIFIVYKLVRELRMNNKNLSATDNQTLAILVSGLLAISPWHIHFSRGGWEVNVATFFIVVGVWLFIRANKKTFSIKYLVLSIISFVASLYAYHAARIIAPLLILGMAIIYKVELFRKENFRHITISVSLGILLLLPLAVDFIGPAGISRAAGVGIFSDIGPLARINEQRGEHADYTGLQAVILHNKVINYSLALLENWSEHFHGEFLFLSGDLIQRNRVPETGQMYIQDLVFLIIGITAMTKILRRKEIQVILLWLLISPVAAALTFQSPHALRAQNMVIPLTMISGFGLYRLVMWLKSRGEVQGFRYFAASGILFIIALIIWSFLRYEHMYYKHMAKEYPFSSQYGVRDLASYIKENENGFEDIIVTEMYDQPYILLLFYLKYPPSRFQVEHTLTPRDQFGFSTVSQFNKYHFTSIDFQRVKEENSRSLIVGTDEEIPEESNIVKEIYGSNGYKYFQIVAN